MFWVWDRGRGRGSGDLGGLELRVLELGELGLGLRGD